ncbi:MAG: redoxin domain-containing protein [Acidimicrobiia bacterium]|nr:redoxin domain-containing protein [Acidimicrobiia bacterium]
MRGRGVRAAVGLAVAALVVVGIAFATRFGEDPGTVGSPLLGRPVPAVEVPALEGGGPLVLPDDVEGEIAIVNFWASWCVPCRFEHPVLTEAARRYEDAGVRVVGILYQDEPEAGIRFLDELGRAYPSYVDERSRAAIEFGVFGVPETFFVDRDGTVVAKVNGEITREVLDDTVQGLLLAD